jgi:carbohydrate kinase (thermoresistant glucokinase family)
MRQRVIENGLTQHTLDTSFDMIDYDEGRDPVRTRPWELRPPTVVILMGVAGSGKTTVGRSLADALGWTFRDADSFHPPANIAKMSSGVPLNDTDRRPWLQAIRAFISAALEQDESAVVTCSALKQSYREIFVAPPPGLIEWVYLKGSRELLARRLAKRNGHFMKAEMLDSQLATLEEPKEALTVDVAESPATLVTEIRRALAL